MGRLEMGTSSGTAPCGGAGRGRTYVCIDLKSFYASVECADRGLDPFETNLVVADPERSRTTICLAVTPAMKALGVPGRCRVYEIPKGIDYIMARPRMRRYMEVSADIYGIYLRHVAPADIHVYSIDECFIYASPYLRLYGLDARGFARMLMEDVFEETGISATAGIGTNLFLAKVALDVMAKKSPERIGALDEETFREKMWHHRPITDIWMIGPGTERRLEALSAFDLGDVAMMDEDVLYREFGKRAEYLIDHAWGQEPCTISDIRSYVPNGTSISNGQVLPEDYAFGDARLIMREMVDGAISILMERGMAAGGVSLYVGYSGEGSASASRGIPERTASASEIIMRMEGLFDEVVDPERFVRRVSVGLFDLAPESTVTRSLFEDASERELGEAVERIRGRFGGNSLLRGSSLLEKSTVHERNMQIGGHRA